jgi:hypothetical protein
VPQGEGERRSAAALASVLVPPLAEGRELTVCARLV